MNCACANPDCAVNGCQELRRQRSGWNYDPNTYLPSPVLGPHMGCVCPVGAAAECEHPQCPRNGRLPSISATSPGA